VDGGSAVDAADPSFHFPTTSRLSSGAAVRRILLLLLVFALSVSAVGCGGARERGKNKDYDRPKAEK
jgi:hypothetical protein